MTREETDEECHDLYPSADVRGKSGLGGEDEQYCHTEKGLHSKGRLMLYGLYFKSLCHFSNVTCSYK